MKKHISVFMLMARCTIYRILGLLAVMVAAETGLFWLALKKGVSEEGFGLEYVISQSHIEIVFLAFFIFVTILLLASTGYETKGKHYFTLMRLSTSRREVFFWQSIYNMICYLLFWAVQVLAVVLLCFIYVENAPPEYVTGQTIFLAFYRNDFLHSLLPFEDILFWIRNLLICMALGFGTAQYPMEEYKPKKSFGAFWGFLFVFFIGELGDYTNCISMSVFALWCIINENYRVYKEEKAVRGMVEAYES